MGEIPSGLQSEFLPQRSLQELYDRFPHSERPLSWGKVEVEVLGMLAAYDYVRKLSAGKRKEAGEETIREIHRLICSHRDSQCHLYQDEGLARPIGGVYWIGHGKKIVGAPFAPVSAEEFYPYLEETTNLFSNAFKPVDSWEKMPQKISQAADVHQRLVHLHPFPDCNGRTAAVVTDAILMASELPQIPIWLPKEEYYQAVSDAISGQVGSLEKFLAQRVFWALTIQKEGILNQGDLRAEAQKTDELDKLQTQIQVLQKHYGFQT